MELPDLPKQNKKQEADFGLELRKWIHLLGLENCSFELKHTRGKKSFYLKELKNEQIAYASKIESDEGQLIRVIGSNGEPDYIYLRKRPAYTIIKYPHNFYIIRTIDLLLERSNSKSISEDRAKILAINF